MCTPTYPARQPGDIIGHRLLGLSAHRTPDQLSSPPQPSATGKGHDPPPEMATCAALSAPEPNAPTVHPIFYPGGSKFVLCLTTHITEVTITDFFFLPLEERNNSWGGF